MVHPLLALQPTYAPQTADEPMSVDLRADAHFSLTDSVSTRFDTYMANTSIWLEEGREAFTESTPDPAATPIHPAEPLVELVDTMRKAFAGFVSANIATKPSFGFNAASSEPVDVVPLVHTTGKVVELLDTICDLLSDGAIPSIAYRNVAMSASLHLKGFLLFMRDIDFTDGLNTSDTTPVTGHCLVMEKAMTSHAQQLQLMKAGVSTGSEA